MIVKKHFIDFQKLNLNHERLHITKEWTYKKFCKCNNYMYVPESLEGDAVQMYSRCVLKSSDKVSSMIFDGKNLKLGFNRKIIK